MSRGLAIDLIVVACFAVLIGMARLYFGRRLPRRSSGSGAGK